MRHPWLWTPTDDAYLSAHYADEGAAVVAASLGKTVGAVRGRAGVLGAKLNPGVRARLALAAHHERMTVANPMRTAAAVAKFKVWRAANPDVVARIKQQLLAGHQRIERTNPSKLEARLRAMLDELGVSYEPSASIKSRFIVDIRIGTLIIQADGDYWHGHPRFSPLTERQIAQQRRDRAQDAYLQACGYSVVRVWESELSRELVQTILASHVTFTPLST